MDRKNSIGVVLSIGMFLCACASAQAQVFLAEGKVRLSVQPGENIAGKLTLHNTSNQEVNMRVYWEDFLYKPPYDGSKNFLPKGTTATSLSGWVNVSPRTLTFAPFGQKEVSYTVNVPADMTEGHYGVLFFEKQNPEVSMEKGIDIVSRVGCLFFIEPERRSKKVALKNFRISKEGLTADFENQGNVILIPDGTFYIIDREGMVFDRGAVDKIYLPAGEAGEYKMSFSGDLAPGTYTLVLTIDLDDNEVLVREIDFTKSYSSDFNIVQIRD